MRSQIRSREDNVKDMLLDCGGWAEREKRERCRETEKKCENMKRKKERCVFIFLCDFSACFSPGKLCKLTAFFLRQHMSGADPPV